MREVEWLCMEAEQAKKQGQHDYAKALYLEAEIRVGIKY